ncbi:MAG: DUF4179 domain-containing protein [Lachnospiraceae bacterium]|nr:DUF4179 domain-containing protein [Lachnospiraceae bacterium]
MKSERFDAIVIPNNLSQRVRKGIRQGEKIYVRNKRKKIMIRVVTAAAALFLCMGIFVSQPALASKIPVIRNIFKLLQGDYSYQGDLDSVAQKFQEPDGADTGLSDANDEMTGENGTLPADNVSGTNENGSYLSDSRYTKTVNGVTVSVSEAYSSVEAIYLSFMIKSEEPFPDTMMNMDEHPLIYLVGTADFSFMPDGGEAAGYANGGTGSIEGKFLDEHTYAGIYRIDILDIVGNDDVLKETYRALDAFDMNYTINQIVGDKAEPEPLDYRGKTKEDLEAMSDEEWSAFMNEITPPDRNQFPNKYENWWFDGPFTFNLHIEADNESAQVVTVDEMNETGAGLYQVVKTKFEITVEEKCSEERSESGVFMVVLDADGQLLPNGSSSFADTYAINGRDVSKVYVYVCDYIEYMDDIKAHRSDADFKEILEKRALYGKEIVF